MRTSRSTKIQGTGESAKTVEDKWILVGSIYGGGNGDYYYHKTGEKTVVSGETTVTKEIYDVYLSEEDFNANKASIATINVDKGKDYLPVLGKTYLELKGGELAHVYGGGNNATVTGNTTICLNNTSDVCQGFVAEKAVKLLSNDTEGHDLDYYVKQTVDYLKSMSKLNTFLHSSGRAQLQPRPCVRWQQQGRYGHHADLEPPEGYHPRPVLRR